MLGLRRRGADQPMVILKHQLSHVQRRGRAGNRAEPDAPPAAHK